MSSAPFDTGLVTARLQALSPQPFSLIGSVVEYGKITDLTGFATPSVYVLPGSEKGSSDAQQRVQVAECLFGVVIAVRNYAPGADGLTRELRPLIATVRDTLTGWMPDRFCTTPVQWVQGDILDFDAGTLVWMDVFRVRHTTGGSKCRTSR
ncbi:hypothetical protein E1K64_15935 [Salmonella enterica subsp. enterica serovar Poona]|nr:hypothetical protein [Salmonella enterica subsp. enterica serovar Poona]